MQARDLAAKGNISAMGQAYKSLLCVTDTQSALALLREFMAEADNVLSHLRAIERRCSA